MTDKVMFSSESEEWVTPQPLFDKIAKRWGPFDLDAAATYENTKCAAYIGKEYNSLRQRWFGRVWLNPPYGRDVGQWFAKAVEETQNGHAALVCMLVPARTDTAWWHDYVMKYAHRVSFIKGRVHFEQDGKDNSAPFPSAIVIFMSDRELDRLPVVDTFAQ